MNPSTIFFICCSHTWILLLYFLFVVILFVVIFYLLTGSTVNWSVFWSNLAFFFILLLLLLTLRILYWNKIDLTYYISFRYITWWFNILIHYKMITMISLVTICHHASYYNIINYIIYAIYYIPMLTCFVTGGLYLLISLTYFTHSPSPFSLAPTSLFSVSMSLFCCVWSFVLFCSFYI